MSAPQNEPPPEHDRREALVAEVEERVRAGLAVDLGTRGLETRAPALLRRVVGASGDSSLADFALALARVDRIEELSRVAGGIRSLMDFHRLDLASLSDDGVTYSLSTLFDPGDTASPIQERVASDIGAAGHVIASGRPEILMCPRDEESHADPTLEAGVFAEILAVPYTKGDAPAGALLFAARTPMFSRASVLMAGKVAALLGQTVRRMHVARELERSNKALSEFAHVASHDLRAPARRMFSFAQLLKEHLGDTDGHAAMMTETIREAAAGLTLLIDDLLQYSRAGQGTTNRRMVDLGAVASGATERLAGVIEDANATVELDALPVVHGSASELSRVLQNLIANAIKFRARGRAPEVRVRVDEHRLSHAICVEDNGVGIAAADAEHAFAPFRRLHGSQYLGSGIGLTEARKIVEHHGGRIWIEPREDAPGTRVWFTLPRVSEGGADDVVSSGCAH